MKWEQLRTEISQYVIIDPLIAVFPHLICSLPRSGENPLPPDDPSKELMGKTEVSLTLANKFDVPGEANAEMDAKTLLLK